jgi:glucan biosynthesis protein C
VLLFLNVESVFGGNAPNTMTPNVPFLLHYAAFFGFGVLVYQARAALVTFPRGAWLYAVAGFASLIVYRLALEEWRAGGTEDDSLRLLVALADASTIWCLFFGLIGVLERLLQRPHAGVRYASDASYWTYLFHAPLAIWIPGLIAQESLPAELKFVILLASLIVLSLVSYEVFVRWTFLGMVLQGRRYPSILRFLRAPARSGISPTPAVQLQPPGEAT